MAGRAFFKTADVCGAAGNVQADSDRRSPCCRCNRNYSLRSIDGEAGFADAAECRSDASGSSDAKHGRNQSAREHGRRKSEEQ